MAMSEEQRKAASERMKAMHEKKKLEKQSEEEMHQVFGAEAADDLNPEPINVPNVVPILVPMPDETVTINQDDLQSLLQRIKQLEAQQFQPQVQQVNQNGKTVGTQPRYNELGWDTVDPANYPSPTDRLANEGRLTQFAFKENYELVYLVESVRYQTIDGIWVKEPKISITLTQIVRDEDGNPTQGRYVLRRGIFFEDPEAAIAVARENGLTVSDEFSKSFLDEMRYLRIRNWLFDIFYPPRSTDNVNKREMVIDGKLVEYYEINSQEAKVMPFNDLKTKI